jgi:hypothetical protein
MMKGLLIRQPWIDLILSGEKTWEIRGSKTKIRGTIALIQSQSGLIVGTADLVGCTPKLTPEDMNKAQKLHQIHEPFIDSTMPYDNTYAWILLGAKRLPKPIPYEHPQGAVIWVNLENT